MNEVIEAMVALGFQSLANDIARGKGLDSSRGGWKFPTLAERLTNEAYDAFRDSPLAWLLHERTPNTSDRDAETDDKWRSGWEVTGYLVPKNRIECEVCYHVTSRERSQLILEGEECGLVLGRQAKQTSPGTGAGDYLDSRQYIHASLHPETCEYWGNILFPDGGAVCLEVRIGEAGVAAFEDRRSQMDDLILGTRHVRVEFVSVRSDGD